MKPATEFSLKKQLASDYSKTWQNEFCCLKDCIFSSLNVTTNLLQIPVKILRVSSTQMLNEIVRKYKQC